jgi:hypothetical protein
MPGMVRVCDHRKCFWNGSDLPLVNQECAEMRF